MFFLPQMLHPHCPQLQEVISGSRSRRWPQIQACWMDSGVCLEGNSRGWERCLWPEQQEKTGDRQAAPLGSALATNQASVASKGHNPWERCGEGLWSSTAHIPQGILVCFVLWGMLTKEICHEEGTGATSGSTRAPEREQWGRQSHRP